MNKEYIIVQERRWSNPNNGNTRRFYAIIGQYCTLAAAIAERETMPETFLIAKAISDKAQRAKNWEIFTADFFRECFEIVTTQTHKAHNDKA